MTSKKALTFGLVGILGAASAVAAVQLGKTLNLHATEVNTWKHFAAVMPTDTTKGIREYWTDCISQGPLFTAPEGVKAQDANLTQDQIDSILKDEDDPRIIPTLTEINRSVAKQYDGKGSTQGYDVSIAYNYIYLDDETKAKVSNADATKIANAYQTFNDTFATIEAPVIDAWQGSSVNPNSSYREVYADGYGMVTEMTSGSVSSGWLSFKFNVTSLDMSDYGWVAFSVYNPTDSAWTDVRYAENSAWSGSTSMTVQPHSWGEMKITSSWFKTYTNFNFAGWFFGVVNWSGYESATETFKISKPVAKKIDAAISDFMDETTVAATDANTSAATFGYGEDETKGKVLEISCTQNKGYTELKVDKIALSSTLFDTVSFSVKTEVKTTFWLCKGSWFNYKYDFKTGAFVAGKEDASTFQIDPSSGWVTLTMSVDDFNACSYIGFTSWDADDGSKDIVGKKVSLSTITAHKISA